MERIAHVAIVGCGLLGASLGLALKQRGLVGSVTGIGRNRSTLDAAHSAGAIDHAALDLEAAAGADLVVIATPVAQSVGILEQLAKIAKPEAVLTDVGSTKGRICSRAAELWPAQRPFIGGHPMAGSEKSGPAAARADLYAGAVCIVEESDNVSDAARGMVHDMWQAVGSTVVTLAAERHDELLALTSHLPHVAAACVATMAGRAGDVTQLVGNGFRDVTRIAASRPEVWTEICLTNREALLEGLRAYENWLGDFRHALEEEDAPAIEGFFSQAKAARESICGI